VRLSISDPHLDLQRLISQVDPALSVARAARNPALENATNEPYRNHLSLIKDLVPEMGRNFKLLYSVKF
jgi:hypothetical protein